MYGEQQHQHFDISGNEILAIIKLVIPEKWDLVTCESNSDFWIPIYDSLISIYLYSWKYKKYEGFYT